MKTNRKPIQNQESKTVVLFRTCTLEFEFNRHLEHMVSYQGMYRVFQKKGINKKLLFGAAHYFNSEFFNLFGFSISVRFLWCPGGGT